MPTDTTPPDYTWPDLWARRTALGLTARDMAQLLGIAQPDYSRIESGTRNRRVPQTIWEQIEQLEHLVDRIHQAALHTPPASESLTTLTLPQTADELAHTFPDAPRDTPLVLVRVAVGRAAATLAQRGVTVRITVPE